MARNTLDLEHVKLNKKRSTHVADLCLSRMSPLYERHKLNNAIKINKRPLGAEKSSRDLFSHRSSRNSIYRNRFKTQGARVSMSCNYVRGSAKLDRHFVQVDELVDYCRLAEIIYFLTSWC